MTEQTEYTKYIKHAEYIDNINYINETKKVGLPVKTESYLINCCPIVPTQVVLDKDL